MPVDIYNYLLQQRILCLNSYVNDKVATQIVGSLMALETIDDKEPIKLYINCSGGQPYSVFGILDTIKTLKPELHTYGLGACYSYASLILASGTQGKRHSMKNTRIMMSQPMGGSQGDMYQIQKTVEELNAIYQMVARYYMGYTGMDQDEVEKATCRDNFLTPEEAKLYGLIDHVIGGEGDRYLPYSVVQKFKDAGLVDDLSKGLLGL
jgi:ATP-dependent Clp protease protease subunit